MSEIRTFLAFPIPKEIKGYFKNMLEPIIDRQDKINWVKRENIHITLNYLGEMDSENVEEHASHIESVINSFPPFKLGTTDTGIYPHANEPRVLWVGSAPYDLTLSAFKQKLDKELTLLGYRLDKRQFQPHITLARVKTISRKSSFIHKFLTTEVREFNFEVDTVLWMKSTLTPTGAEYEELKSFKFNSGGQ
ncbi:MAG: RNA 2',3'-cyclic phosphodiesterase [Candidatus Marinimicrobia bacterium]|jgi:2'-5' RNA ligase|nr:RNA 2',3'-cyclic phosphodiesterase [Candidatus Neomarinimicrobiota bacterium]MBT3630385.1 RNA 2',3'-cyclic phosphodiesterase [Candidatus Neomarinimicrobiota bacterium]MBT3823704.1 RNA 2',3'-cyclic phosphodiesterase [Candidatus Neomarinimicrobiota bacterium]MBT4131947.1 RNA 2',3'-cyclic phosphodiesterase [Candidatus Neomarinimicrobiota bacterium]MBT4294673.1 RNA 2',3'-cyclic phosphodiesterase [Candidatus Neomarinimicrobiota bacterium]